MESVFIMPINQEIDDWGIKMGGAQASKYTFAPIQEAVIDLIFSETQTFERVEKASSKLKRRYPQMEQLVNIEGGMSGPGHMSFKSGPIGFHLSTLDMSDIVQIQIDRLTTSRTAPYEGWEKLLDASKENWRTVSREITSQIIRRVGIRYINRIDIPLNGEDSVQLSDYLSFLPNISPISGEPMTEFTTLVTRLTRDPLWTARIISTLAPPVLINHMSVLFDIDVYREKDIPIKYEELWKQIDGARILKNEIFEKYLTEKSRKLFNA
jgi:uncharacterized protein (TIGR04255 family)